MGGISSDLPQLYLQACCKEIPCGLLLSYGPSIALPCHRLQYSTVEFEYHWHTKLPQFLKKESYRQAWLLVEILTIKIKIPL